MLIAEFDLENASLCSLFQAMMFARLKINKKLTLKTGQKCQPLSLPLQQTNRERYFLLINHIGNSLYRCIEINR